MKSRRFLLSFVVLACVAAANLTMATPKETPPAAAAAPAEKETKKNTTILILNAAPEKVHAAALEALAAIGCKIKSDTPTEIEGKRSNKVGLAVGSGGEKLFVSIKNLEGGKTELTVTTKKTMVGIVGQKLWNEDVANQIRSAVN